MFLKKKFKFWHKMMGLSAVLLCFSMMAGVIVEAYRTDIDKFIGTQSSVTVSDAKSTEEKAKDYRYQSDYASTKELVTAIADVGERLEEEGCVLLKNQNGLPLSEAETGKISLLGYSSYSTTRGGDSGAQIGPGENDGTDAPLVDFVGALAARGYEINPTVQELYSNDDVVNSYSKMMTTISEDGDKYSRPVSSAAAPGIGGLYMSQEPSQELLAEVNGAWKDSLAEYNTMIITIARSGGENRSYVPGTDGIDDQGLNQADPLGLSDDERDLIQTAVDAKTQYGGKVIVLLNNSSAMEVQELEDNAGIDAILQVGMPGGYGYYGVVDILTGEENPSGHLTDTYAVDNSSAPSAQNYGSNTWVNKTEDDAAYYINGYQVEAEGIYDGYYYYETRYYDSVMNPDSKASSTAGSSTGNAWDYAEEVTYPFGYGLSYTTFQQTLDDVQVDLDKKTVTAQVTVKNTGKTAGKSVVELYVSTPYTDYDKENAVEKSAIQLLDYGKTEVLLPGEETTVTITADAQYMASWNSLEDSAAKGAKGTYILDAGTYYFAIGNGAHEAVNNVLAFQGKTSADGMTAEGNAANVKTWDLETLDRTTFSKSENGTALQNQLENMDLNYYMEDTVTYLSRSDWEDTFPVSYAGLSYTENMLDALQNNLYQIGEDNSQLYDTESADLPDTDFDQDNGLVLCDLIGLDYDDEKWDQLLDQLSLEDCMLRIAFGGVACKGTSSVMSPLAVQSDGPVGFINYPLGSSYATKDAKTGDPCTISDSDTNKTYKENVMCAEPVVASTFNKELVKEYGEVLGNYSLWSNTPILWGCGTNLHRSPYNARNNEYYSEDPMLSSLTGAAFVEGGLEYGLIIAPKHYAFNDTEIDRKGISTFMTEQKAREMELRGTQECIEEAGALGVMSAFNRAGVTAVNAHYGLMYHILREEWGFKGLISEDAIYDGSFSSLKEAVICGVTLTCNTGNESVMTGHNSVAEKWAYWTTDNVKKDPVLMSALKRDMHYMLYALANSNAMDGMDVTTRYEKVNTWYDYLVLSLEVLFAAASVLSFVGYCISYKKKKEDA